MTYAKPTPADLKARYSAFSGVDDGVVQYWLTDAERYVDESWPIERDYAPALIDAAAHGMVRAKAAGIATDEIGALAASGLTQFRSGTFHAVFSDAAAARAAAGDWASTDYGYDYYLALLRNKGGPLVTSSGYVPCGLGFNGFAGPLPGFCR